MLRLATLGFLLATPALAAGPVRVAVLYFDVQSTNESMKVFSKGLSELMITDLAASTDVVVVERARLEDVLAELKLGETRFSDPATAAKIGKLIGAQYLVTGTLMGLGDAKHRLMTRIIDVTKGQVVPQATFRTEVDPADVFVAEELAVAQVAKQLHAAGVSQKAEDPPKKTHRLPLETAAKYARALDAKDKKDTKKAVELLSDVVKDQPDFKLAQLDLLTLTK